MILAGDVGGTKTRLALYAPGASARAPEREQRLPSREFDSLEALVRVFIGSSRVALSRAVFGIAGPVVGNRTETTNLPWTLDGASLGRAIGCPHVTLLNDLETTGWGLSMLAASEQRTLQAGVAEPGNRAMIAAGTGLGEGVLVWDGVTHRPTPSEGGHADFGPQDALEDALNVWLRARHGHVSYERVLSGPGLADVYRFLADAGHARANDDVAARFAADPDPAGVVSAAALDGSCERATLALDRWLRIYGAEAGNLALKSLAVNGVFVGGGIAPRVAAAFGRAGFIEAFRRKGRLSPVLERIPIYLVLDDRAALWGAAVVALQSPAGGDSPMPAARFLAREEDTA